MESQVDNQDISPLTDTSLTHQQTVRLLQQTLSLLSPRDK